MLVFRWLNKRMNPHDDDKIYFVSLKSEAHRTTVAKHKRENEEIRRILIESLHAAKANETLFRVARYTKQRKMTTEAKRERKQIKLKWNEKSFLNFQEDIASKKKTTNSETIILCSFFSVCLFGSAAESCEKVKWKIVVWGRETDRTNTNPTVRLQSSSKGFVEV